MYPTVQKWCTEPKKIAEANDILVSVRAPVGPTNLASERCCIGRGLAAIRAYAPMNQKYLLHHFRNIEPWLGQQGTGTTFKAISKNFLESLEVPIAPLPEQKRIADKLDSLLQKVDTCQEHLDRVPQIIDRFQQSVLAEAMSGRLTVDWREGNGIEGEWKKTKFFDFFVLMRGYDLPLKNAVEGPYAIVTSAGIAATHNEFKAKAPGVVTGRSGSVGNVHYINQDYWPHNTTLYVQDF